MKYFLIAFTLILAACGTSEEEKLRQQEQQLAQQQQQLLVQQQQQYAQQQGNKFAKFLKKITKFKFLLIT